MAIKAVHKRLIQRIINVFETGSPEGHYDSLVIHKNGKNNTRQITYGRSQTTEQSNLKKLIKMYIANEGEYADQFERYVGRIGVTPLVNSRKFKNLLKDAAREDEIMRTTQDEFFDKIYWDPAYKWFDVNGFKKSLSMLVIYDSFIHSGRIPSFLRKRFMAVPPAMGGNERQWVASYVEIRHQWLKHHSKPILRKTIYRTQTLWNQIEDRNWALNKLPIDANGTNVF